MSVERDQTDVVTESTSGDQSTAGRMADTAKSEASNVASTAADGARDVAGEVGAQAKAVAGEAKEQLDRLVSQSRQEIRQQAEQRNSQAVGQLRTLSEQLGALLHGRPEAAGPLAGYASDLQYQIRRVATRMEQGGPQGLVDDVTRFARRRPGAFLAGAAGVGFVVGRLVRAGAASQRDDSAATSVALPASNGPAFAGAGELPPPTASEGAVR
jgi:hypothetical protein